MTDTVAAEVLREQVLEDPAGKDLDTVRKLGAP